MRVLCCGDRDWADHEAIRRRLSKLPKSTIIIEGECRGADRICKAIAKSLGFEIDPYPAKWNLYGRSAGPIRNQQMLDEGKPELVIAFHSNLAKSKGTLNMITKARKAGVLVEVIE